MAKPSEERAEAQDDPVEAEERTPEVMPGVAAADIPKFCPECGTPTSGARFCGNCGRALATGSTSPVQLQTPSSAVQSPTPPTATSREGEEEETEIWRGSPDPMLSPVAAKTTTYVLTTERLRADSGVLGRSHTQMELFRVKDVTVKKNLRNRARSRGDVLVFSVDSSSRVLKLEAVEDPDSVAELIRNQVRKVRARHGVTSREFI